MTGSDGVRGDIEALPLARSSRNEQNQIAKKKFRRRVLALVALGSILWASVVTALYVGERRNHRASTSAAASPRGADTSLRSNAALGIRDISVSYVSVVVSDPVADAAKYYEMLGFYPVPTPDGSMTYTGIEKSGVTVDIIFLKHETIDLNLELYFYYRPEGDLKIPILNSNDSVHNRQFEVEVEDAVETYNDLDAKDHRGQFITEDTPGLFYWIDKYGVQWGFRQSLPNESSSAGIVG